MLNRHAHIDAAKSTTTNGMDPAEVDQYTMQNALLSDDRLRQARPDNLDAMAYTHQRTPPPHLTCSAALQDSAHMSLTPPLAYNEHLIQDSPDTIDVTTSQHHDSDPLCPHEAQDMLDYDASPGQHDTPPPDEFTFAELYSEAPITSDDISCQDITLLATIQHATDMIITAPCLPVHTAHHHDEPSPHMPPVSTPTTDTIFTALLSAPAHKHITTQLIKIDDLRHSLRIARAPKPANTPHRHAISRHGIAQCIIQARPPPEPPPAMLLKGRSTPPYPTHHTARLRVPSSRLVMRT